ncbi:sentrin-specific protease 5-like [Amphiprion ocellaris]|uniref:Ubiquitin-like protease family profile domain-containing protein n=1 Tax=Amphiprion ocellaris TaxID=80972 RepID=A0A3Q1BGQ5_AMPOC|nr:sentrin-specific protease 5-like [Amphiprion ocellaris]
MNHLTPTCPSSRQKVSYSSMITCESPLFSFFNLCQMHQTHSQRSKAKCLKRRKGFTSSIKGVSHLSRRAKRRLYCKLQLWMWRKRREKCRFGIFQGKKRIHSGSSPCLGLKTERSKRKSPTYQTLNGENSQVRASALVLALGRDTGGSEDTFRMQNRFLKLTKSDGLSGTFIDSDTNVPGTISQTLPTASSEITGTLKQTVRPLLSTASDGCEGSTQLKVPRTMTARRLEAGGPSEHHISVTVRQEQTTHRDTDGRISCKHTASPQSDISLKALTQDIHEFLDDFYRTYGSFIPLQKSDVLRHLKRKFNSHWSDRKNIIFSEVTRYQTAIVQKSAPSFQVVYKKHTLTLDDLLTLADQNWLNDQVMNMYGELIMESSHHKVHFLNSFFHRQLMTKGYDGVKRWTKQVDLFSKSLLLVPVHLEVHWCLVTADIVKKKICLYDSQGNALQKVARNILKYLMTEAKEKQQTAFENGWVVSFDEKIPQQTNENDCGVFVLEYSRCLALTRPLQFSQNDIPKIRKRIYKELCDCRLHEQD